MIWLSWRQQRFESALAAAAVAAAIVALLLTHQQLLSTFTQLGIPSCLRHHSSATQCLNAFDAFKQNVTSEQTTLDWVGYLPILIGVLLAATLAIEFELGTYRLSWTQGITRGRWATGRLGLALTAGLLAAAALSVIANWWLKPLNRLQSPLLPGSFDIAGVLPAGYLLFAFATTVAVAIIWRKTLPALGLGIAAGIAARSLLQHTRPTLLTPVTKIWWSGTAPYSRRDWLIQGGSGATTYQYADTSGRHFSADQTQQLCGHVTDAASKQTFSHCLATHHIGELIRLQPPTRFWEMQLIQTGTLAAAAVALLVTAVWWLKVRSY